MDDAIPSVSAECVDSIFMVSFHFVLLSSCQRELHPTLPPREQFKPNKMAFAAM